MQPILTEQVTQAFKLLGIDIKAVDFSPRTIEILNLGQYRSHEQRNHFNAYIGRWRDHRLPGGLYCAQLGNHHPVSPMKCDHCGREHDRKASILEFENDSKSQTWIKIGIIKLAAEILKHPQGNVQLWCHCSPMACHGDVIVDKLIEHFPHLERI